MTAVPQTFVNYAHRGASSYAPENTLLAFYMALGMGANGIETDVQMSRDGVPVLFHDDTLTRVCRVDGSVQDYRWDELGRFFVYGPEGDGQVSRDRICRLETFLHHFAFRELTLAIEIKQDLEALDEAVLSLIDRCGARERSYVTSFHREVLARIRARDADIRLGYLVRRYSEDVARFASQQRIGQLCLAASELDADAVHAVRAQGFELRAWGVRDEALMRRVLDLAVDGGMTVNFPDRLAAELRRRAQTGG